MKIAIFGAAGGTGKRVVERALADHHDVIAVARRPESIATKDDKLHVVKGDVLDRASIESAIDGIDAVICTFGPASNAKPGTLMSQGIANVVAACEARGVERLVFESGLMCSDGTGMSLIGRIGVSVYGWWYSDLRADKRIAERSIESSKLSRWVIVRPPALDDAPATGKYIHGVNAAVNPAKTFPHADVAELLIRAASDDAFAKTIQAIGFA